MTDHISYPPLNTPKQVADGVWIVDAAPVHAGGIPLPIRMMVLRLAEGGLLQHSPMNRAGLIREAAVTELKRREAAAPAEPKASTKPPAR